MSEDIHVWGIEYKLMKNGVKEVLVDFVYRYIAKGKRACKDLFTNSIHYTVFSNLPRYPYEIYVSRSYVALGYRFRIGRTDGASLYLIGVNSDGKLFINKMTQNYMGYWGKLFNLIVDNGRTIPVYLTEDDEVYLTLGYEVDLETSSDKSVPRYVHDKRATRYRIQGDLVMEISSGVDYYNGLRDIIGNRVERILNNIIAERIFTTLQEAGFSSTVTNDVASASIVLRCLSRDMKYEDIKNAVDKIASYIMDMVDISDLGAKFNPDIRWNVSGSEPEVGLWVREGRGAFGDRYTPIEITVFSNGSLVSKYVEEIMMNLRMDEDWHIARFGRHMVRYHGYPRRFTIMARLPKNMDGEDEYIIPVETPLIYLDGGDLYVYHPEHGDAKYNILESLAVQFRSTLIDREFEDRLNYYALKKLMEFMELKKYYKLA
jgi:hypothetical protein